MKRVLLTVLLSCLLSSTSFGHESDEAFFQIRVTDSTVEVEAEFPWTLRKALMNFNPSLARAKHKNEFEKTFTRYLKANLMLKDHLGKRLPYMHFIPVANDGHSHQSKYLITYAGTNPWKITNTLLFNVNKNQVNHHFFNRHGRTITRKTLRHQQHLEFHPHHLDLFRTLSLALPPLMYPCLWNSASYSFST